MTIHCRQYSPEFEPKLVLQLLFGEKTTAELCLAVFMVNTRDLRVAFIKEFGSDFDSDGVNI